LPKWRSSACWRSPDRVGDASPCRRSAIASGGRECLIDAKLLISAPPALVWQVLTDYDRLSEFVPDLIESRLISRPGEPRLLEQRGRAKVAMFNAELSVTLRVDEFPIERLEFEAIGGNVREMRGRWLICGLGEGTRLEYFIKLVPAFWMPASIGPALVRRHVDSQLSGLEAEVMRRAVARPSV
jgi:carbon monoxide dehydrogenase subunit G